MNLVKTSRRYGRWLLVLLAGLLSACGGGSGGGDSAASCSVAEVNRFVRDRTYADYLFQDLLPASVDPLAYADPQALLDAMTAEARALGYDRGFSYVTSITADNARFQGQNAGFGFRLALTADERLLLPEVFETAPAATVFARGTEIVEIDDGNGYRTISEWLLIDPTLDAAFGPAEAGVSRGFRYRLAGDSTLRETQLTKAEYSLDPISNIDGVAVLQGPAGEPVGYLNLRSFVSTADSELRSAFASFGDQGIQQFIVDLRYNGGGLVSIAELLQNLLGEALAGQNAYTSIFKDEQAEPFTRFTLQSQSVTPLRIAFITTAGSASASELVINTMNPYLQIAIVGANTYGKPVGQSAIDDSGCDLRLRLVTFRTVNAEYNGDYYDGLASSVDQACAADDDLARSMADPLESSTAAALDWLDSGSCSGQTLAAGIPLKAERQAGRRLLRPGDPAIHDWLPGAV